MIEQLIDNLLTTNETAKFKEKYSLIFDPAPFIAKRDQFKAAIVEAFSDLVAAAEVALDYIDTEYNDGTPGDPRPKRGDYDALDDVNDALRNALHKVQATQRAFKG